MKTTLLSLTAALAVALGSCHRGTDPAVSQPDVLVAVGSEVLTRKDVARQIPGGVSRDDSTALAKAYVRSWIEARLISKVAAAEVDMDEIDRLTAEYRSELIMGQYRRAMARQAATDEFSEDTLRAYYDAHLADLRLERPLVRGIYLKVPDDAPNLGALRRFYKSDKDADIDRLEKAALSSAIHYDYFRDRWVDWEQIGTRIPDSLIGRSPAEFLNSRKALDVSAGGFVYLLSVSDHIAAGQPMPFDAARPLIRERLLAQRRRAFDSALLRNLYDRSVNDGTISFPNSNPLE